MRTPFAGGLGAALLAVGAACATPIWAESGAEPSAPVRGSKTGTKYSSPRTPWGDPDIQGIWSSDDEAGVPFERPDRQPRTSVSTSIGGDTGAGPPHWYEFRGHASTRAALVIDPVDGRVPPLTPAAERRQQGRVSG